MPTYNLISQNNDDDFYTALCAYVRGDALRDLRQEGGTFSAKSSSYEQTRK
jgi:hypothetical protein